MTLLGHQCNFWALPVETPLLELAGGPSRQQEYAAKHYSLWICNT